MAEEEKKEETAAPEGPEAEPETKADADEEQGSEEGSEPEKESDKDSDQDLDWKKIAEDERQRREKAEGALATRRFKSKERGGEDDSGDDTDEDGSKPLTAAELRAILAEERKATQREFLQTRVREVARSLAESDDEASAIVEIHNNRTFPDGMTLEEQVNEAYYIAHGPRLRAKRDELRRSLKGKNTTRQSGAENTHRDQPKSGEPKISPQDKAELQRLGFAWDGKQYAKKLQNGKTLVKDWQTKKVFVK